MTGPGPGLTPAPPRYRWLDESVLVVGIALILVLSVVVSPGTEDLALGGHTLPPTCVWRQLTGHRCPGCGMTRSFVFMGHGLLMDAFRMHPLGPALYALVVHQLLLRLWLMLRVVLRRTQVRAGSGSSAGG